MELEINKLLCVGGISQNIHTRNLNRISFGNTLYTDTVELTSTARLTSETAIKNMIDNKVKSIVKDFNPELTLNMKELKELLQNHAVQTKETAYGIIENLPFSLQNKVDKKAIDDAAYLHDLGKVLIPTGILNKSGKLTEYETKIMHTHSQLSYELLKNTNLGTKTLQLIRNHHQNAKKSGYPFVGNDFNADLNLQILSVADKYSALTEKRVYKDALSPKEALTVIYADIKDGKIHPLVFKALVNHVSENTELLKAV